MLHQRRLRSLRSHLRGGPPLPAPVAAANAGKTVAIITGSSSGIGEATCYEFARRCPGICLLINYNSGAERAEAVAAKCRDLGAEAITCGGSIASDEDCKKLVAAAVGEWGGEPLRARCG